MRSCLFLPVLLACASCSAGDSSYVSNTAELSPTENVSDNMVEEYNATVGSEDENSALADSSVTANDVMAENDMATSSDGGAEPHCEAIDADLPAAECAGYMRERASLADGLAVFSAPSEMTVGETRDLILAVGKKNDAETTHASVGGPTSSHVEVATSVGHYMTASLSGGGFEISPEGPQPKTLSADRREAWQWRIKAKEEGAQRLLLTISVDATLPDGTRSRYDLERKPYDVVVKVTDSERKNRAAKAREDSIDRGTHMLSALEKWLLALAAVIGAASAVWIAVRVFGKRKDK